MTFDRRLFIWLSIAFVLVTVVGTITHEFGHYIVAKSFGYRAHISYGYTWYYDPVNDEFTRSIYSKYQAEIKAGDDFPEKEKYERLQKKSGEDGFWIWLGGPLETNLTGTIGLIFLFLLRKSFYNTTKLAFKQWFFIFISLFWLRPLANFVCWAGLYIMRGKSCGWTDEFYLAYRLNLPEWTIAASTALIGAIVLTVVIIKFVPTKQRLTFIASGLVGGITGAILWLELLGKVIMP